MPAPGGPHAQRSGETAPTDGHERGHIVVCSVSHVGLRTVLELQRWGETVVVVSPTPEGPADRGITDVRVVAGDFRLERILRAAGVAHASAVVLAGDDDLGNLEAALAAEELQPGVRIVIRLFDGELGGHLQALFPNAIVLSSSALAAPGFVSAAVDGDAGEQFTVAGKVLTARANPGRGAITAAPRMGAGARVVPLARLNPDRTVEILPDAPSDEPGLLLVEVADPEEAPPPPVPPSANPLRFIATMRPRLTVRERLRELPGRIRDRLAAPERRFVRFAGILIGLAAVSAMYFLVTARLTPLDAVSYAITLLTGASLLTSIDPATAGWPLKVYAIFLSIVGAAIVAVVYAFITDAIIRSRLLQTLGRRSVPASIRDHVIVCGLGSIGYRVALGIQARGVPVVVIEPDEDGRFVAAARAVGIPVVAGDARQRELLVQLGVMSARAVVAATSSDLINISAAMNARSVRPDVRVVMRLFDPDFAVRVQRSSGIRFTRSVSNLAAPAFAAAATGPEVLASMPVGDRRTLMFVRMRVPPASRLVGTTVAGIDLPGERRILAVAEPGVDVARWWPDPTETLDPDEQIVLVTTRQGFADVLQLARASGRGAVAAVDLAPARSAAPG
jgi:Trk K+ transport system NAD-binding subunit